MSANRSRSASRTRRRAAGANQLANASGGDNARPTGGGGEASDEEPQLVVRLRDKPFVTDDRPKSRLGQIGERATEQLKDTIKRPLTSLFRRSKTPSGPRQNSLSTKEANLNEIPDVASVGDESGASGGGGGDVAGRIDSGGQVRQHGRFDVGSEVSLDLIAHAPLYSVNHMADESNFDFPGVEYPEMKRIGDTDLSLLLRLLPFEEDIKDDEFPWTWDFLYSSILTESQNVPISDDEDIA